MKSEEDRNSTVVRNESSNPKNQKGGYGTELVKFEPPEENKEKPGKRSMKTDVELSIGTSSIFDFEAFEESQKRKDGKNLVEYSEEKEGKSLKPTEAKKKQYEHRYSTMDFRISPRKLRLIANQIAGKSINEAIEQMEFSRKRASKKIMNSLITARDHAWRYKMMSPEEVYVEQAFVGKGLYKKRPSFRARGRFSILKIKRAHMKYILRVRKPEKDQGIATKRQVNADKYKPKKNPWVPLVENKPIYNPPRFYNCKLTIFDASSAKITMKQIENDSPNRRSPRIAAKRNSLALQPARSCLRKNDDTTTNFDLLQEDNTNLLGIACDSTATFTLRNFDDTGTLDENGRRRKSLGRRVSFAATAHVRLFDKDEAADDAPATSKKSEPQNEKPTTEFMLALPATPSPNNSLISNNDPLKNRTEENGASQAEDPKTGVDYAPAQDQQKVESDKGVNIQDEEVDMTLASLADRDTSVIPKEPLLDHENKYAPVVSQVTTNADEQDMCTVEDMSIDELDMSLVDVTSKDQRSGLLDSPVPMLLETNEVFIEHATDMEKDMLIDQDQMHDLPATEIFDMSIVRSENGRDSSMRVSIGEKNITEKQFLEFTDMSLVEETQMVLDEDVEMSIDEEDTCMSLSHQSNSTERKSPEKQTAEVVDVTSEELRFMNEAIDEQNAQIQIFENEFENLKNDLHNLRNRRTKLKNEKLELIQASKFTTPYG
ncbi:14774_t:CDS:2 [Acaulospora colombiana]|uniref:14774_t:CDS:1 n=1 Tax=Acaulospora colombiana TaxID=27376 RepID=A0ACA9KJ78_9GLOM|nr:14774_t:CDS:2 [Acaulospora colombiana]